MRGNSAQNGCCAHMSTSVRLSKILLHQIAQMGIGLNFFRGGAKEISPPAVRLRESFEIFFTHMLLPNL